MQSFSATAPQVAKWTAAVLAAAIAMVTAALPSESAESSDRTTAIADRLSARRAGDDGSATAFALGADVACLADPAGDTAAEVAAAAEPRADIVEVCAEYGDALTVRIRPVQATDPTSDRNWTEGFSAASVGVEVDGDESVDYLLFYENLGGLQAVVTDPDLNELCRGTATFDGTWFAAADVPADCLGSPDSLGFFAALFYDTDHADPEAPMVGDFAPDLDYALVDRAGAPAPGRATARYSGDDRFATSAAVSRAQFPGTAAEVYLARADGFADALSGGTLTGGPVLLVPACGPLPPVIATEIARLDPERVVALGGAAAVCDAVLAEAAAA